MRTQLNIGCALAILLFAVSTSFAGNGTIGIFADTGLSVTEATVPCNGSLTLYVYALLDGETSAGITGAEYSVAVGPYSLPDAGAGEDLSADGLLFIENFGPATSLGAITIGAGAFNPVDPNARGINLAFPDCQNGDGSKVLLQTVQVLNLSCVTEAIPLRIIQHDSPNNPAFRCPLLTKCDAPVFTKLCVGDDATPCAGPNASDDATCSSSGQFLLNPQADGDIAVTPNPHDYGGVPVGDSPMQLFEVSNEGLVDLEITQIVLAGLDASQYGIENIDTALPATLATGEKLVVQLSFHPDSPGVKTASLRITSNDPDENPLDVALSGEGVPLDGDIAATPNPHDYGGVPVGDSPAQLFDVSNAGPGDLAITQIVLAGLDVSQYGIENIDTALPATLASGEKLVVQVSFHPDSPGVKTAELRITSDDPDENPLDVVLSGEGVPLDGDIAVTPNPHDYGGVPVGDSPVQSFDVSNEGLGDLAITQIALAGLDASQYGIENIDTALPATLATGEKLVVQVSFHPDSPGVKTASLRITSDDPDENPLDVALSGEGQPVGATVTGTIGIFADTGLSLTEATVPCNGSITLYVYALLDGETAAGITGAEYSVAVGPYSLPDAGAGEDLSADGLLFVEDFTPATSVGGITIGTGAFNPGDPDARGINLAFPDCQNGDASKVLLQTVQVMNVGCVSETIPLRIIQHDSPGNPMFRCPLLTTCDAPVFTKLCVGDDATPCAGPNASDDATCSSAGAFVVNAEASLDGDIAATPNPHDYGVVPVGDSPTQLFDVSNAGPGDLEITQIVLTGPDASQYGIENIDTALPATLATGEKLVVQVSFHPDSPGVKTASLRIVSDDPDENPLDVALSGEGQPVGATVTGTIGIFADTGLSLTEATVPCNGSITLYVYALLDGETAAGITGAEYSVAVGPYSLPDAGAGEDLSADGLLFVEDFTPATSVGGITIGTGAFNPGDPDARGINLAFPDCQNGDGSKVLLQTVQVMNVGCVSETIPLRIIQHDSPGNPMFRCPLLTTCDAPVFTKLCVGDDATPCAGPNASDDATCSSAGAFVVNAEASLDGDIAATPNPHDYGVVPVGDSPTQLFDVSNAGPGDLEITQIVLTGPDASQYGIENIDTALPATLATGEKLVVQVSFHPDSPGVKTASLRITSDDPDENPLDVALSGEGQPVGPTVAGTIGIFADTGLSLTEATVPCNGSITLYVYALLDGETAAGITGAEYSVAVGAYSLPDAGVGEDLSADGLLFVEDFTPATSVGAITIGTGAFNPGDPDARGINLAFPDCQNGDGSKVLLQTVQVMNVGCVSETIPLRIIQHDSPSNPMFRCPLLTTCDAPVFTKLCVGDDATPCAGPNASDDATCSSAGQFVLNTGAAVGEIAFKEKARGSSEDSETVRTSGSLEAVNGDCYLASISSKSYERVRRVVGMGLTWTKVRAQCSVRGKTGVEVWKGEGTPVTGRVTATLDDEPDDAVIVVTRYSGVDSSDPIGNVVSGNKHGISGGCGDGSKNRSYSLNVSTSVPNAMVFGAVAMRDESHTPGAEYTERDEVHEGRASVAVVDRSVANAGPLVLDGRFGDDAYWAVIGLELKPRTGLIDQPDIAATPNPHDYGGVPVGDSPVQLFDVSNAGPGDLEITQIVLTGLDASQYGIENIDTALPATLATGEKLVVQVSFHPDSPGVKNASLRITSNDPDENPLDVALSGEGQPVGPTVTGTIGIFADTGLSLTEATVPCNGSITLYVYALLDGETAAGITGAEYSVAVGAYSLPDAGVGEDLSADGLLFVEDFTPATSVGAITIGTGAFNPGDPDARGINLAFPDCQNGDGSKVLLQTVQVMNVGCVSETIPLRIIQHDSPGNPMFRCPLLTTCDAPVFTKLCVGDDATPCAGPSASDDATCSSAGQFVLNTGAAVGEIAFEEKARGSSSDSETVKTSRSLEAVNGDCYLASISSKSYERVRRVVGMGLTWTKVRAQCSVRGKTGVEVWKGEGTPVTGRVTATLDDEPDDAVIVVTRYSGVDSSDPIGNVVSGNKHGISGGCGDGSKNRSYSLNVSTSVPNAMVFGAVAMREESHTPGAEYTERDEVHEGRASVAVVDRSVANAGPLVLDGRFGDDAYWAVIGLELKPQTIVKSGPVSEDETLVSRVPVRNDLYENFPNPLNPSTTIRFSLIEAGEVRLVIYDVSGRVVSTLYNGFREAGIYEYPWRAEDQSGRMLPSGIYLCRIETGYFVKSIKMVVAK